MTINEKRGKKTKFDLIRSRVEKFIEDLYSGEITYKRLYGKLINAVKVFIVASRKFMADDCPTKASSIAYTTIISLIPTLTVGLTFYSIFSGVGDKKDELFRRVTLFMLEHNIKLNIDPILESISSLIENAGKIGGIGAVIVVFTATAVLRTLEKSLNNIWQVKKQRAFFLKIVYYWAALTLAPVMFIAGTTVATQISTTFSPPNYKSAFMTARQELWLTGHKAAIARSEKTDLTMNRVPLEAIDLDNQKVYEYVGSTGTFRETEFRIEKDELGRTEFRDIQFIGDAGWIVGKNGLVLATGDGGATWSLHKWGAFRFNDIHMVSPARGFIAADNGYLLETSDGGKTWSTMEIKDYSSNLNAVSFSNTRGIIVGDRGTILMTDDGGKTWKTRVLNEAKIRNRHVRLNSVFFAGDWKVWIAGDEGLILSSGNGGLSWKADRFMEKNYYALYFDGANRGFIGGEKGTLLYTENGGEKWVRVNLSTPRINRLLPVKNGIAAAGDAGMILMSRDGGKTWQGQQGGNTAGFLLNFFAPFAFIWVMFLLMYIWLPNMKVPFKPAAIGASFTGAVWVAFILLFIIYVKSFAKGTFAIYGGLAAIPIFLLMVYASSLIMLYGAEISYTLMHPHTYARLKTALKARDDIMIYFGIAVLYTVYKRFEDGKGPTHINDLLKATGNRADEVDYYTALFVKESLILQAEGGGWVPTKSSKNITL
ncbi:MAG TPA: YihY family inner membrane protein, partial [Spirochaetes bacterium]|nr:YihY family inner membrane protein [Spirochaetota bacterium]